MAAKHTLNVSLTQPLREFIAEQVGSGRFQTASEVVRSALRLLQSREQGDYASHTGRQVVPRQGRSLRRTANTRQVPP